MTIISKALLVAGFAVVSLFLGMHPVQAHSSNSYDSSNDAYSYDWPDNTGWHDWSYLGPTYDGYIPDDYMSVNYQDVYSYDKWVYDHQNRLNDNWQTDHQLGFYHHLRSDNLYYYDGQHFYLVHASSAQNNYQASHPCYGLSSDNYSNQTSWTGAYAGDGYASAYASSNW